MFSTSIVFVFNPQVLGRKHHDNSPFKIKQRVAQLMKANLVLCRWIHSKKIATA